MTTSYPYAANFETKSGDSNSGFMTATPLPGSFASLGNADFYQIQVAGKYYFSAQVGFNYDDGVTDLIQVAITLYHLNSAGDVIRQWATIMEPQNFNGVTSAVEVFSLSVSAADVYSVGDIAFIQVDDASGTSTTLTQSLNPSDFQTVSFFDGFFLGT